tara:strand:+ start:420 stop:959 length:540 start_codon:yes stop_codon:yes gene_type:complete
MKNILKIIVGVVIAGVLYVGYMVVFPVSPLETITYSSEISDFEVVYSRPYKNDRLIFGSEAEGALVPFNQYWRTGANAATTFETSKNILFNNQKLKAGKYRLYTIPNIDTWKVVLNSEADKFFAITEPDSSKDILAVKVASSPNFEETIEQFTIDFSQDSTGLKMNLKWEKTILSIPLK